MNTGESMPRAGLQRSYRLPDFATPALINRERSFVRPNSHHHYDNHHQIRDGNKRKSMVVTTNNRGKPTMEIYRPPTVRTDGGVQMQNQNHQQTHNKLNVHAKEFTMNTRPQELQNSRSSVNLGSMYNMPPIKHSKSSGNILHQLGVTPIGNTLPQPVLAPSNYRHPMLPQQPPPIPLLTSASSGNLLHNPPRVHFKLPQQTHTIPQETEKKKISFVNNHNNNDKSKQIRPQYQQLSNGLKRSKSLTSADTLASGMAALGLTADASDLGVFPQEVQENLDKATKDPNQLPARTIMELVGHVMRRAVESPRYALPAARHCIAIIEKEKTPTFLESLLNTCQQWYQDREKVLNMLIGGGRPRLMAFISLLLELFCQLRRRCPQSALHQNSNSITPPARSLLTLICKCCEECIRAPVPSASDTENLFFVLTFIGRDLETHLPGDLENLLSAVRDAFLNTSAAPSVTKTLLQLIELHASHWQLPGGAVLYYYPTTK